MLADLVTCLIVVTEDARNANEGTRSEIETANAGTALAAAPVPPSGTSRADRTVARGLILEDGMSTIEIFCGIRIVQCLLGTGTSARETIRSLVAA